MDMTKEDFEIMKKHLKDEKLKPEDFYSISAIIADNQPTAYYSILHPDTLQKFSDKINSEGVPHMISHNTGGLFSGGSLPTGKFYKSMLKKHKNGMVDLMAKYYIPKNLEINGTNTDEYVKAVETGVVDSMSIGFNGKEYICSICGFSIFDCPHMPSKEYNIGDGKLAICYYTVMPEGADLHETSSVYAGAVSRAKITNEDFSLNKDLINIKDKQNLKTILQNQNQVYTKILIPEPEQYSLTHNSRLKDNEPQWSTWLSANRSKLPDSAFCPMMADRKFPHHWVENGEVGENGRFTSGDMYLHRGGLNAGWASANGARSGQKASQQVIGHLEMHRKALDMSDSSSNSIQISNEDLAAFDIEFTKLFKGGESIDMEKTLEQLKKENEDLQKENESLKTAEITKKAQEWDVLDDLFKLENIADIEAFIIEAKANSMVALALDEAGIDIQKVDLKGLKTDAESFKSYIKDYEAAVEKKMVQIHGNDFDKADYVAFSENCKDKYAALKKLDEKVSKMQPDKYLLDKKLIDPIKKEEKTELSADVKETAEKLNMIPDKMETTKIEIIG